MDKVKKGDNVTVITGKDKGKTGKVLAIVKTDKANKVVVEGMNIHTKHKKARRQDEKSEIIKAEAPIDASNVMVVCPSCGKPTRVGFKINEVDGKKVKVRICAKCKGEIPDNNSQKDTKEKQKRTRRTKKSDAEKEEKRATRSKKVTAEDTENKD